MEMKQILKIAIAAVLAVAFVLWLRPSESKRIRKVFATAASELRKDGPEGLVAATAKARALAELVAPDARFEVDGRLIHVATTGRQLVQEIILVRRHADKIEVGFADIAISFEDKVTAAVTADIYVTGLSSELGLSGRDARQLEAVLSKNENDGKWRFTHVSLLPVVAK